MAYQYDKRAIDWGTTGKKVNSQHLPANFTPTNYTPAQVGSEGTDKVSAHLKGIDTKLATSGGGTVTPALFDTSWNGSDVQKDVTVSSKVTDARKAVWALHDNANNYERIFCKITATSASNVRIDTNLAFASGTYRLIGFEDIS
jgi:hypothetical protein